MTESKTPLTKEKMSEPTPKVSSTSKATLEKPAHKNNAKSAETKPKPPNTAPTKISKLAVVAIVIAMAAPAGHYYWQSLQNQKLKQELEQTLTQKTAKKNSIVLNRYKAEIQQALSNQEQSFTKKLQQITTKIQQSSQSKITELTAVVEHLERAIKQRQPSDWLLHEAEYLIRISARTLWLEHDTHAAIGLLKDANARLTELNDPTFLPVRETIQQDITALTLMPTLETDDVIVTLMAMSKQVAALPLAIVDVGQKEQQTDINLSNNINDWQSNLAKTWQKFLNDFIRVRQRTGTVEALISPDQQKNLKQNLSLKIQLALWAATERKDKLYQQSLADIQLWLNEFFDMENEVNQLFYTSLTNLKNKKVAYNYPSELNSLTAIRATLRSQKINSLQPSEIKIKEVKKTQPSEKTAPPTKPAPIKQSNQTQKNEGSSI